MPLIRIQPDVLLCPETGLQVVYDAKAPTPTVYVCPPGAAIPIEYKAPACDPVAVWCALLARVPPTPDAAHAMLTGLEDLSARLTRLERAVEQLEQETADGDAVDALAGRVDRLERRAAELEGKAWDADPGGPDGSTDRVDIAGPACDPTLACGDAERAGIAPPPGLSDVRSLAERIVRALDMDELERPADPDDRWLIDRRDALMDGPEDLPFLEAWRRACIEWVAERIEEHSAAARRDAAGWAAAAPARTAGGVMPPGEDDEHHGASVGEVS